MIADFAPAELFLGVGLVAAALSILFGLAMAFGARMRMKRLVALVMAQIGVCVLAAMSGRASSFGPGADPALAPTPGLMTMTGLAVAVATLLVGAVLISQASRESGGDSAP